MKRAFTLIELLVVIAIIAILAAILFPVFARAKAAAKKTQALSNVKQLATGYLLYTADYDGMFYEHAQGMSTGTQNDNSLIWNGYINPYTKNAQIAIDPAANTPALRDATYPFTGLYFRQIDYRQLSLGLNQALTSQFTWGCLNDFTPNQAGCRQFFSETQFQFPAQHLLFASSTSGQGNPFRGFWVSPMHNLDVADGMSARHIEQVVVSFIDGHAKAYNGRTLLVRDQVLELDASASGQCVNFNSAKVYWDPTAPNPQEVPDCEGFGIR